MNKKITIIGIIIIVVLGFLVFRLTPLGWQAKTLFSPGGLLGGKQVEITPNPTPIPTPDAPKTFKFDSSTDLKAELDKVNPQVLDSDFE